jgi:hypothetical protein
MYLRDVSAVPGPLQVSTAEYQGSKSLDLGKEKLVELSRNMGGRSRLTEVVETDSGPCPFGNFGTVVFKSAQRARVQFWHLSNGRDVIFVSHICEKEPDPQEVLEASQIVMSMELVDAP